MTYEAPQLIILGTVSQLTAAQIGVGPGDSLLFQDTPIVSTSASGSVSLP